MRRVVIIVLIIAIVAAGVFVYIQQTTTSASPQQQNIRTATVDRGDLVLTVSATGAIAAAQTAKVSFDVPGLVSEVLVQEGQTVKAGDVLARQDNTAQKLAVAQAESTLNAAAVAFDELNKPTDEKVLSVAQANIRAAQGAYNSLATSITPSAIRAAELQYQRAVTAWNDAIDARKGAGGQYANDDPNYQLALAREGQASFNAEIARLQFESLKKGVDSRALAAAAARIRQAQAAYDQLKAGPRQADLDRARLTVQQAQLALDQAKRQLEKTELKAPFSGVISSVLVKQGALSVTNLPAFVITDNSEYHVNVKVDEVDIGQLREGQIVTLTIDALPDQTLTGKIDRIGLTANDEAGVVTYSVRVTLDPTKLPIRVGMTTSATITVRSLSNVLRVPNLYVRIDRRTNEAFVNLVNGDGTLAEVPVLLGFKTEEYSEVVGGLNEGDKIGISLDSSFSIFGN